MTGDLKKTQSLVRLLFAAFWLLVGGELFPLLAPRGTGERRVPLLPTTGYPRHVIRFPPRFWLQAYTTCAGDMGEITFINERAYPQGLPCHLE